MEEILIAAIFLYLLSAAAYLVYFLMQRPQLPRAGLAALFCGFLLHTAFLAAAGIQQGHFPAANLRETLFFAAWAVAGAFLYVQGRYGVKVLGLYAAPLVAGVLIAGALLPGPPAQTTALFQSLWLMAHVTAIFLGEAAFALACGVGILYLLQEKAIKTKKTRYVFRRLPSLELLDNAGYGCIVVGFALMTLGLITGLVYARAVWGRFWTWDPKEVWSGVCWLYYAALLHGRLRSGWRGRRSAWFAIAGFGILLFTFLGVNLLWEGHHRAFTR